MAAKEESARAQAAYEFYLGLGPTRTLDKVHANHTKPAPTLRTIGQWSMDFGWVERARAYDAELAARERAQREAHQAEERERRHQRRLKDIDKLHEIADEAADLMAAIKVLKDAKDILKFFEFIHKGERLEMGEPSAIINLQDMSDAEFASYAEAQGFRVRLPSASGDTSAEVDS